MPGLLRKYVVAVVAAAAFISFAAPRPAGALFLESQMDRVDTEALFDAEYFADLLGFSYPMEWDFLWSASSTAYRINTASLDCCDLFLEQEVKLQRRLTRSGLDFRWHYIQYEDKDRQDLRHLIELEHPVALGFSALIFGEPAFKKEDADIGLGVSYRPVPGLKFTARRTFVDFNFNSRGSTTQSYTKKPLTDEFRVEADFSGHRLSAGLEIDHPLRRLVPSAARLYSYRRTTLKTLWEHEWDNGFRSRIGYDYEFLKEGNLFNPDPGRTSVDFRRNVHHLRTGLLIDHADLASSEAGIHMLARSARSDTPSNPSSGVFHTRWEVEPYWRFRHKTRSWLVTEAALFYSGGETRHRYPENVTRSAYDTIHEVKLGTSAEFTFGDLGMLSLNGSWDLDAFTTHLWDGGNIRAMMRF